MYVCMEVVCWNHQFNNLSWEKLQTRRGTLGSEVDLKNDHILKSNLLLEIKQIQAPGYKCKAHLVTRCDNAPFNFWRHNIGVFHQCFKCIS